MPFYQEEIWHLLKDRSAGKIVSSQILKIEKQDNNDVQKYISTAKDIITSSQGNQTKTSYKMKGRTLALDLKTEGVDKTGLVRSMGAEDIVKN